MTERSAFFVDSNVLVYAYDDGEPVKQRAAIALLERLQAEQTGALSAQVLGEVFVTITRKIGRPLTLGDAERQVVLLERSWSVLDVTSLAVIEAVRAVSQHQISYWDGLIWATAKLNGVGTVLSEDFSDGSLIEGVRFLNPFAAGFAAA
jgi:predicted nucleic acid-binding protein